MYRAVVTNVTTPTIIESFQTAPSEDFLLNYIYVQFPTIGVASPSVYQDIKFTLKMPQQGGVYIEQPVSFEMVTSPGRFNNFSGGNEKPNQQFFRTKKLSQPLFSQQTFHIEISNYLGAGNPLSLELLIMGRNVFKPARVS
jgi:hypothetical protein